MEESNDEAALLAGAVRDRKAWLLGFLASCILASIAFGFVFPHVDTWLGGNDTPHPAFSASFLVGLASIPLVGFSLLLETRWTGWDGSSLKTVLSCRDASTRTDIAYFWMHCSGAYPLFGILFSLGLAHALSLRLDTTFAFAVLHDAPYWVALPAYILVDSLVFYGYHWMEHREFFWEFHKVHHAAERMNMLNNFRMHPFSFAVRGVVRAVPAAVLGVDPAVMLAGSAFIGLIVIWQHSPVDWRLPWVERYLFVGAAGHRVHHSVDPRHHNRNLGYLVLWDWLFGTLCRDRDVAKIGVEPDGIHNQLGFFSEMVWVMVVGSRALVQVLVGGMFKPRAA